MIIHNIKGTLNLDTGKASMILMGKEGIMTPKELDKKYLNKWVRLNEETVYQVKRTQRIISPSVLELTLEEIATDILNKKNK